jgi:hypothetical protein
MNQCFLNMALIVTAVLLECSAAGAQVFNVLSLTLGLGVGLNVAIQDYPSWNQPDTSWPNIRPCSTTFTTTVLRQVLTYTSCI